MKTRITISVAGTRRREQDFKRGVLSTTSNAAFGFSATRLSRSRRTMFSTSMIASSTTSPSEITSSVMIIVLIVSPHQEIRTTVATKDKGMAVMLMRAVRQS